MVLNRCLFISLFVLLCNILNNAQINHFVKNQSAEINRNKSEISGEEVRTESFRNILSENPQLQNQSNHPTASRLSTDFGLIFEYEYDYKLKNSTNTDRIQLKGLNDKAQAIQFRLLVNKVEDDSTILIFENLQKGADVSDTSWSLVYNVIRGTILPNGASADEILVLLFNQNQNGGLNPGDYEELIKVNYEVVDLPQFQDSIKSSMKISNATASNFQGFPINITPSRDEFSIILKGIEPKAGLVFAEDTVYRLEAHSYSDVIQLKGLTTTAQALQFRLLVNKAVDDNVTLTFQNLEKGDDISDPSWVLNYNVFRGPLTGNGASVDEILVLLFNLQYNNGLLPGDYDDLLKVKYRVADLPALQDSIKSSIKIAQAEASTFEGFPIDITPSHDELTVIALNRVGFYGDVNGDGCLNILDIIMIVDHIVGRDSLEFDEFQRADIAPWIQGNQHPNPDKFVNVQDLSLLQNIILTGVYPNGIPITDCGYTIYTKTNWDNNKKVTFYINNNGITAYLNTDIEIRGVQIEFSGINDNPGNMTISTDLGQGYYGKSGDLLRILLYDRKGQKIIPTGENLLAEMPFRISNPENIKLEKLILIDINRQLIVDSEVEIIFGYLPFLPIEYILYQNYPNPFNPNTTIEYSLPKKSNVILTVYDILGNEISVLVNEQQERGLYSVRFDAPGSASGVYFYRIQADSFVQTKKMMLMK